MQRLIHQLALETGASVPTIRKWLADPGSVGPVHQYALSAAAENMELGDRVLTVRNDLVDRASQATGTEG